MPVQAEPGKRARFDYEYVRNGTANVFMFVDVEPTVAARQGHRPANVPRLRRVHARSRRRCTIPDAERIRVVLDNLSAHRPPALYERFAPAEARRILERLEFHFTPKHASWLNMVEIEIGVMVSQCLDRRIPDKATLVSEIAAWERRRNAEGAHQLDVHRRARPREARRELPQS